MKTGRKIILVAATATVGSVLGLAAGARLVPARSATADAPPPPCTFFGCSTAPPPPASTVSPPATSAPLPPATVSGLTVTRLPGRGLELRWSIPAGGRVAAVIVRRGQAGHCPAGAGAGTAVGGVVVRTRQADPTAANGSHYCYAVFTRSRAGLTSAAATAAAFHPYVAPAAVTGVTATVHGTEVLLSWTDPSALTGVAVVRSTAGGPCPGAPGDGTRIGTTGVRQTQADPTAGRGRRYCYSVFALGAGGTVSAAASTPSVEVPAPRPAPAAAAPAASPLDSTLVRVVGAVAGGAITFALILFLGLRLLSGGDGAGMAAPVAGRRLDLGSMNAAALVIPVLVVVLGVGVAAVAGFLLL